MRNDTAWVGGSIGILLIMAFVGSQLEPNNPEVQSGIQLFSYAQSGMTPAQVVQAFSGASLNRGETAKDGSYRGVELDDFIIGKTHLSASFYFSAKGGLRSVVLSTNNLGPDFTQATGDTLDLLTNQYGQADRNEHDRGLITLTWHLNKRDINWTWMNSGPVMNMVLLRYKVT